MDLAGRDAAVLKSTTDARADTTPKPAKLPQEAIRISISDPKAEETKVRQLYDALIRIKGKESQQAPISYQQFAKYIATQTLGIQKKHGCAKVSFTISLDQDSIKFTAAAENR
jgi:hypothetical protein